MDKLFTPLGLEVVRWTKLPYLSEGDIDQYFYWLDDYVVVLKEKEMPPNDLNVANNYCYVTTGT